MARPAIFCHPNLLLSPFKGAPPHGDTQDRPCRRHRLYLSGSTSSPVSHPQVECPFRTSRVVVGLCLSQNLHTILGAVIPSLPGAWVPVDCMKDSVKLRQRLNEIPSAGQILV
jgi:hypothetical protein